MGKIKILVVPGDCDTVSALESGTHKLAGNEISQMLDQALFF